MNDTKSQTVTNFAVKHGVALSAMPLHENPNIPDFRPAHHWACTLEHNGHKMETYFSQGMAHDDAPTVEDLLGCLASDACASENSPTFEGFAADMGYDDDSRQAERTYNLIEQQTESLKALLGVDLFEELLHNTERE